MSLTIVIPVKNPPCLDLFMEKNAKIFSQYPLVVIDSGGGEKLKEIATVYISKNVSLWEARKLGYQQVKTPYLLNLDVDVVPPEGYIESALALDADAITIFYEDVNHCQGSLEYGVSIWKTDVVKELYDFDSKLVCDGKIVKVGSQAYSTLTNGWCECIYMWRRLKNNGYKLETLPMRAKHLKILPVISKHLKTNKE